MDTYRIEAVRLGDVQPSHLFWVKVGDLQYGNYCRPVSRAWAKRIRPAFEAVRLGPLLVNQRQDLTLFCYDGRQRAALVAALFGPDEEVGCHVTPRDDTPKQIAMENITREPWPLGDPENVWEARRWLQANACQGETRTEREENRARLYTRDLVGLWYTLCRIRRDREAARDAAGGIGPVQCDRLVPGHAIGDPYYLQWEMDIVDAHG